MILSHRYHLDNATQVQPPSIWVIDLELDQVIRRFEIPTSIITDGHGIASITPDVVRGQCRDAFAYLPDLVNYRLHVYSLRQNRVWSFTHNHFSFDPIRGDFDVAGVQYQWNDGIFSVTLGNRESDGFRQAYFHAMASISEFSVSTRILQNETMSTRSNHGKDFKVKSPKPVSPVHSSLMRDQLNRLFHDEQSSVCVCVRDYVGSAIIALI